MIFDELRAIQLRHGYLPKAEFEALSRKTQTLLCTKFTALPASIRISTQRRRPIAHVKTQGGAQGFFKRLTSVLVGREEHKREDEARERRPARRWTTWKW